MKDISKNVQKVMAVFLFLFIAMISYLMYVYTFDGEKIEASVYNNRKWVERSNTVRGDILDRNGNILVTSKGVTDGIQELEYKGGAAFAHVLGYMDSQYGLTGIQNRYDKELMGKTDTFIPGEFGKKDKGYNVETTLDMSLQQAAYSLMGDQKGSVVAMDPESGEILTMVSTPSFDPNQLKSQWQNLNVNENSPLLNRSVAGMYPPGSTFKIITAVSALENLDGVINRRFDDKGKIVFNDKDSLSNSGGKAWGNIGLEDAFAYSSNVVFGTLGMDLGNDKLKETAEKFYFNKDIPANGTLIENSRFPELNKHQKGEIAQSAIGQSSILATPIEMALVSSTIANDGVMMKPTLVKGILNDDGKAIKSTEPEELTTVTTPEIANTVKGFMKQVVNRGTGTTAVVKGVEVYGKTGTADHSEVDGQKEPHSWFVGFAEKNGKKLAFAIVLEEGGAGSQKTGKIVRGLVQNYFNR